MYYKMTYRNGKNIREHRAIMQDYLGRELHLDELIHHKDGNKQNNDISNLEITTRSKHAKLHIENLLKKRRPVMQKDKTNNLVKIWDCALAVQKELGFSKSNICNCCRGKIKSCYGYKWEYADVRTK